MIRTLIISATLAFASAFSPNVPPFAVRVRSQSRAFNRPFMQLRPQDKELRQTSLSPRAVFHDQSLTQLPPLRQTASNVIEHPAPIWYEEAVFENTDVLSEGTNSLTAARGMILLAAVLCGTNFGAVKILQDSTDAPVLLFLRFLICAVAMSPFLKNLNPRIIAPAAEAGTLLGLGYLTQAIALETAPAGVIAFLCSLTTITCPFIEKLTGASVGARGWAACGMAVLGAAMLELGGGNAPGVGDLWGLLQPVMFGLFFWKTERAMQQFPGQALPFTTVQVFVCALLGALWSVVDAGGMPDLWPLLANASDVNFVLATLWLGLVSTAGVLVLQTLALGTMPSSETAVVFSSEPLWGVAFANMLLGEAIGSNTVVGGSLIIAACLVRVLDFDLEGLLPLEESDDVADYAGER